MLAASLKTKRQYVLCVRMTPFQKFLYMTFMQKQAALAGKVKLFAAYQCFLRLWNHPCCTVLQTLDMRQLEKIKAQQAADALHPKSKGKPIVRLPGNLVPYVTLAKELSATYNYFEAHSAQLLQALEASTRQVEEAMLRPTKELEAALAAGDALSEEGGDFDEERAEYGADAELLLEGDGEGAEDADRSFDGEEGGAMSEGDSNKRMKLDHFPDAASSSMSPNAEVAAANSSSAPTNQSFRPIQSANAATPRGGTPRSSPLVPAPQLDLNWWKHTPPAPSTASGGITMDLTDEAEQQEEEPNYDALVTNEQLLGMSGKMVAFLSLLALSVLRGDKVLVFSQSLYTLDVVELFLRSRDWGDGLLPSAESAAAAAANSSNSYKKFSQWRCGCEYLRIDGKTKDRQDLIDRFNGSSALRLFMVCTKAGNMGINLYSANRVVIFDSSWNPVHDLQAISRSYRYGQQKEVFVYRLVAADSMEEVIYKRQMVKQALAARVIDAQMPDNQAEGGQLMDVHRASAPESSSGLVLSDTVKVDGVLMGFVEAHPELLAYIADQEVLLEDKVESHLNEEDQRAAEAEYEREIAANTAAQSRMGLLAQIGAAGPQSNSQADTQEDSQPMDLDDGTGGGFLAAVGALGVPSVPPLPPIPALPTAAVESAQRANISIFQNSSAAASAVP